MSSSSPYNYKEWLSTQSDNNSSSSSYEEYLNNWYKTKRGAKSSSNSKQEFIQFLKELATFLSEDEKNEIISNINFDNELDIISTVPFFIQKIKDYAKSITRKREDVKNLKSLYSINGSKFGLEKIIRDQIFKKYTNKSNNIEISTDDIKNLFPQLSSIKDSFFIELEELYDTGEYYDKPIIEQSLTNSDDVENDLISFIIPRLPDNKYSDIFKLYASEKYSNNTLENISKLNQKYLGSTIYSLTANQVSDSNDADFILNLDLISGNNWFFWPFGNYDIEGFKFSNIYTPISINDSNLIQSGATAGETYQQSDVIFSSKSGIVEGAWLKGFEEKTFKETVKVFVKSGDTAKFLFPYTGFSINQNTLEFENYIFNNDYTRNIESLNDTIKTELIKDYYTKNLPNVSSEPMYLNQSSLVDSGAFASIFSDDADSIIKRNRVNRIENSFTGLLDSAYLYKIQRSDLPVTIGQNLIYWPYVKYETNQNIPITILNDACLDINLNNIDPKLTTLGCVAGYNFDESDVIFKLDTRTNIPIEAAWLQTSPSDFLDLYAESISVYNEPATICSNYISGPIQNSLCLKIYPMEMVSFIWFGVDTYADDVFKFVDHSDDCPYKDLENIDYYKDQTYQNPSHIRKNQKAWKKCTCKSLQYSPIGHSGDDVFDYNRMTDVLFHDPKGVGSDFTFNGWRDTRNLSITKSPQFAHFKLNDDSVKVGWGSGYWKTGNGEKMVLKTGKRYTYYRTSLRRDNSSSIDQNDLSPYMVVRHPYRKIIGIGGIKTPVDLVIVLDISRSQTAVLDINKQIISEICKKLLDVPNTDVQVGLIIFDSESVRISYLTKYYDYLILAIENINIRDDFTTNILDALKLAELILTQKIPEESDFTDIDFTKLCSNLENFIIEEAGLSSNENLPRPNASKKILIFSDGNDNINEYQDIIDYADSIKNRISINSFDIGHDANFNQLMEDLSSDDSYFNLQNYLLLGDGDLNSFIDYIFNKIKNDSTSVYPKWKKAVRDENGNWIGTNQDTDLVLSAGDYLTYIHRDLIKYKGLDTYNDFVINSLPMTINIKLNGWNYTTNSFSSSAIGDLFGAKPFWAVAYNNIDVSNNFSKYTKIFGGHIRFLEDYIPIQQPEISEMIISNGDYLEYTRREIRDIIWNQSVELIDGNYTPKWKKLLFEKRISNISDILKISDFDKFVIPTNIDSDMILESYSIFKSSEYNYFARSPFIYQQELFLINKCLDSFSTFQTGSYINSNEPYKNLLNTHYPTIAMFDNRKILLSKNTYGEYLIPTNMGVSFYLGRGYKTDFSIESIQNFKNTKKDLIFWEPNKYGGRNRGFTENDQESVMRVVNIDNTWMYESFFMGEKFGIQKKPELYQKFTPYQTHFESIGSNLYGVSKQDDSIDLWESLNPMIFKDSSKLNERNELITNAYEEEVNNLLLNRGQLFKWKTDIYGNDFGLFLNEQ